MGKLGFLFELDLSEEKFLVFVEHKQVKIDSIVGSSSRLAS